MSRVIRFAKRNYKERNSLYCFIFVENIYNTEDPIRSYSYYSKFFSRINDVLVLMLSSITKCGTIEIVLCYVSYQILEISVPQQYINLPLLLYLIINMDITINHKNKHKMSFIGSFSLMSFTRIKNGKYKNINTLNS